MTIRPVDYNSLVPKAQELSQVKQIENNKTKTQMQQNFVYQHDKIEKNLSKVQDLNKSEMLKINVNGNNKENKKERKKSHKKKRKKKKDIKEPCIGNSIDVKI